MEFKVYPMRRKGRRLQWKEIDNGPSYVGDLRSHLIYVGTEPYSVITLFNDARPANSQLLPDLYEPVLLRFAVNAFQLRGYEKIDGPDGFHAVVQEWHCVPPPK
jgi:hypothetical protein